MEPIQFISRNLALKEFELKDAPNGKQVAFSIKFVKKNGVLVFIPRAVAAGLRFNLRDNCMRGILPEDTDNNASGHVTPCPYRWYPGMEWKKIRM